MRVPFLLVDDGFDENPKIEALTDRAYRLHHSALTHCSRNLTDGLVTLPALRALSGRLRAKKQHVSELVQAGLWIDYGARGFIIHDFLAHNPTKAEVQERREKRRESGRLGGLRSGKSRASAEASASKQVLGLLVEPHPIPSHKDQVLLAVDNSLRSVNG